MVERVKARSSDSVLQAMLKFQSALLLIVGLVIYLEARTLGKILALLILSAVLSVVAYVHLKVRFENAARVPKSSIVTPLP